MSKLEKLPQKNLKFILKRMNESLDKTSLISYHNQKVIKEIFDDIGMVDRGQDIDFIFALYRENPNFLTEELKLPTLHEYEIITKRYATISIREYWKNTHETYLDDEDDVDDFISWFGGGDWWNGEMIDREEFDEETAETEIDEINKLS
jgi:ABC-type multidrug transport system ATPase subunit